jgi:hypothetical protein
MVRNDSLQHRSRKSHQDQQLVVEIMAVRQSWATGAETKKNKVKANKWGITLIFLLVASLPLVRILSNSSFIASKLQFDRPGGRGRRRGLDTARLREMKSHFESSRKQSSDSTRQQSGGHATMASSGRFIVHHTVANVTLADLHDLDPSTREALGSEQSIRGNNIEEVSRGKEPLLQLLRDAGIINIDSETIEMLPTWGQVEQLYGSEPSIIGLDTCLDYQERTDTLDHRILAPAGLFNTGTNLLATLLESNCQFPDDVDAKSNNRRTSGVHSKPDSRSTVQWQVPWGKHVPSEQRRIHRIPSNKDSLLSPPDDVLPVVLVRDPYFWIQSLCRHPYSLQWEHNNKCPSLVDTSHSGGVAASTLTVQAKLGSRQYEWPSLVHVYNDWNRQYYHQSSSEDAFPRLIIRMEDLIFFPKQVVKEVCKCGGGVVRTKFRHMVESVKEDDRATSTGATLVSAMIRYGSPLLRTKDYTSKDLDFMNRNLDQELLNEFNYNSL